MATQDPKGAAGATPDDLEPVTITTTVRHLETMRYAMLRELKSLYKGATESVHDLSEVKADYDALRAYKDTRSHVEMDRQRDRDARRSRLGARGRMGGLPGMSVPL